MQNPDVIQRFEQELIRQTPADYHRHLQHIEALCQEARLLGAWPSPDPLDGLDADLHLARALNVRRAP